MQVLPPRILTASLSALTGVQCSVVPIKEWVMSTLQFHLKHSCPSSDYPSEGLSWTNIFHSIYYPSEGLSWTDLEESA